MRLLLAHQATDKLADGLICFCSIWPGIKKSPFWTGTAPIPILPCIRDIPQSCFCISVLATKIGWDNSLNMNVHCIYTYILWIYMYILCTYIVHGYLLPSIVCIYNYCICHTILACTSFVIGMYHAIIEESATLYRQEHA